MQIRFYSLFLGSLIYACSAISTIEESPAAHSNNNSKDRTYLVKEAQKYIGSKYRYGGTSPKGFDCSGFTSFMYQKVGISLPRSSSAQAQKGKKITPGAARPGDLLFFRLQKKGKTSHVAMVVSNDRNGLEVIHSTTSRGVIQEKIDNSEYWAEKLLYGRNYIDN